MEQFLVFDFPKVPDDILTETRALPFAREGAAHPGVYRPSPSDAPHLYDFLKNVVGHSFDPLQHVQVNRFQMFDLNPWHHDGCDPGITTIAMLYLTGDTWAEADGGYLELGHKAPAELVTPIRKVTPAHGRAVVILDTMDPNLVHRVEPPHVQKERISVIAFYGKSAPTTA